MRLELPDVRFRESFLRWQRELEAHDPEWVLGEFERLAANDAAFSLLVEKYHQRARGEGLPAHWVPDTTWWMVEGEEIVGRISLRHRLDERLEVFGGHIGYEVRPSFRRRGFATSALSQCLAEAKKMNLSRVLLTCADGNLPSIRTIESNGGVLQDRVPRPTSEGGGGLTRRYWISL